ncbi:cadherin-like domain-containing protein [Vibrio chagasii]|nr:cadherin-like domain-containing protein [Vibrio chagasii]
MKVTLSLFGINYDGVRRYLPSMVMVHAVSRQMKINGQVQLDVTIQDENGATVETHINVDVLPINDPPVSG